MFFCLFATVVAEEKYIGNWSLSFVTPEMVINDSSNFQITLDSPKNYQGLNWSNCTLYFSRLSKIRVDTRLITANAIYFPEYSAYYIFYVIPDYKSFNDFVEFVNTVIEYTRKRGFNFTALHENLQIFAIYAMKKSQLTGPIPFIRSFNATYHTRKTGPYLSGYEIYSQNNIKFEADFYDVTQDRINVQIFLVLYAICVAFNFYAWRDITQKFTSENALLQLSPLSILLHTSFDFAHGFYISIILPDVKGNNNIGIFVIILVGILIYVIYENAFSTKLHAYHTDNFNIIPRWARMMIIVIAQTVILMIQYYLLINFSKHPLITFLGLFSFFLPQVLFSIWKPNGRKKDTFFVVNILIYRGLLVLYYGLYPNNITRTTYPKESLITLGLMMFEAFIIILQNYYGGRFFIPKFLLEEGYNYYSRPAEEGAICPICLAPITADDVAMTTPCDHVYHSDCLERWMEEELVCPMCRAEIPPLTNFR